MTLWDWGQEKERKTTGQDKDDLEWEEQVEMKKEEVAYRGLIYIYPHRLDR